MGWVARFRRRRARRELLHIIDVAYGRVPADDRTWVGLDGWAR
jgi:hypothetical protein